MKTKLRSTTLDLGSRRGIPVTLFVTLFASSAAAQSVTNRRTGAVETSLAEAYAASAAGDVLELRGSFTESLELSHDIALVGADAAEVQSDAPAIFALHPGVKLAVRDVNLTGLARTRAIDGAAQNSVVLERVTVRAGIAEPVLGEDGGAMRLLDGTRATLTDVAFIGVQGTRVAWHGGALYLSGKNPIATLERVRFEHLVVAGNGGGVRTSGNLTCRKCVFDHTNASIGGAIEMSAGRASIEQSSFCGTSAGFGGAIAGGSSTIDIHGSVFQESSSVVQGSAIYGTDTHFRVINAHFVGNTGPSVFYGAGARTMIVKNSLFAKNTGLALRRCSATDCEPAFTYNWFFENTLDADVVLDGTNMAPGSDPLLTAWSSDGDCSNDSLEPLAGQSPLIDAGDPAILDRDGTRSDIGAFGGTPPPEGGAGGEGNEAGAGGSAEPGLGGEGGRGGDAGQGGEDALPEPPPEAGAAGGDAGDDAAGNGGGGAEEPSGAGGNDATPGGNGTSAGGNGASAGSETVGTAGATDCSGAAPPSTHPRPAGGCSVSTTAAGEQWPALIALFGALICLRRRSRLCGATAARASSVR